MITETDPLPADADALVGYLETLQRDADEATFWRRVRTRRVTDDERQRRAVRDFRAVVGRVNRDLLGPSASGHPGLPAACDLVKDFEFREQVYSTIESTHANLPWWHTYSSPYAEV